MRDDQCHVEAAIRQARQLSNAAIARHCPVGACAYLTDAAIIVTSGNTIVSGRTAMMAAFERMFARPGFKAFIRTPVRISYDGADAAEIGDWAGLSSSPSQNRGGVYLARWTRVEGVWRVLNESFAPVSA